MSQENNNPGMNSRTMMILAIVFAVVAVVLVILLFQTRSNLKGLLAEKEQQRVELQSELDSLLTEHERVKLEYGQLSDSLSVKDSVIRANAIEIRRLLDTEWEYYKVKKKLGQLQLIAQGYVRQMDSLYTVNAALTQENQEIRKDLKDLRKEKEEIEKDREQLSEKVEIAAVLKAVNMEATGLRMRTGGEKEVPTDKVQRVDQVRVCFTVGENKIASAGKKDLYIRIARPDQEILAKSRIDDFSFEYQGELLQYSMMQSIDYNNAPVDLCMYWKKEYSSQEMQPGLYHVDIFCENAIIGHTTFTLR
jgi:regulator of replication initiation timing